MVIASSVTFAVGIGITWAAPSRRTEDMGAIIAMVGLVSTVICLVAYFTD